MLHDLYDHLLPRTPEEQRDLESERARLTYKLRHVIRGWRIRDVPAAEEGSSADAVRAFVGAFRAEIDSHWRTTDTANLEADREQQAEEEDEEEEIMAGSVPTRTKAKHIEETLRAVLRYDKTSDDSITGTLALADALQDEIVVAMRATLEQQDARFSCGHELEMLMAQCKLCIGVLDGFTGSVWRPLSRLRSRSQRAVAGMAAEAVRARHTDGKVVMQVVHKEDRRKLLDLVLLGRRHFPFLLLTMFFSVLSGSIRTMHRWQNAEVMNFFIEGGGAANMAGFRELLTGVLMTRLIDIALSRMSKHLDKHGTLRMRVTMYRNIYAKMMAQDMSYFEEKFKQKDQARVMIFTYCNKTMSRVERTLWRVQDLASIISSLAVLLRKDRRLLGIMMVIFPFRTSFVELMGSVRIRLKRRQDDTECATALPFAAFPVLIVASLTKPLCCRRNFDFAELMGMLDTRASFAATRFTGREKVNKEKFRVVMSRWEKNELKMRSIGQIMNPVIDRFPTTLN